MMFLGYLAAKQVAVPILSLLRASLTEKYEAREVDKEKQATLSHRKGGPTVILCPSYKEDTSTTILSA